jgi:acetyltransferase-like isoleucine patch superfamily enzyme
MPLLIGYRLDALGARLRAALWRCLGVRVGSGAKVHAGVRLRCAWGQAELGERAELYRGVQVLCTGAGRFSLGAGSHMAPGGYLLVGASTLHIGAGVAIGPQVGIFCETNGARAGTPFTQQHVRASVSIGDNVFLGARVTVLPGAVIERDVVVAAHAVVRGRLASGYVYGGVPARALHALQPRQASA